MAQHRKPSPDMLAHPVPARVDEPFDWSGVKCEWNQNHCQGDSVALVESGATVMIAGQAPEGFRAPRHLCRTHYQLFRRMRPAARVIQHRPGSREER